MTDFKGAGFSGPSDEDADLYRAGISSAEGWPKILGRYAEAVR